MNSTWTGLLCYTLLIYAGKIPSSNGCLTWSVNGDNLLLICRWNNYPQTISIYDKNSVPNVNCYLTANNYYCTALLENSNITVNYSSNEITFIIQSIQETDVNGKWYCSYGNQVSETEVSLSKGIIKSTRINITAELISTGHLNEVKVKCSSCRAPRNNNAEILVNNHSVDSLTYSANKSTCVQVKSNLSSEKRICKSPGTDFTLIFPFIKHEKELNISCVMQFIDNNKKSRFYVDATVYCNLKGCHYTGSVTTVTKLPEDERNIHIDQEKDEELFTATVIEGTTSSNVTAFSVDETERRSRTENTSIYIILVVCVCMIAGIVIVVFIWSDHKRKRHAVNVEFRRKKKLDGNGEDKMNILENKILKDNALRSKDLGFHKITNESTEHKGLLTNDYDPMNEDTYIDSCTDTVVGTDVSQEQTYKRTIETETNITMHSVDTCDETSSAITIDDKRSKHNESDCNMFANTVSLEKDCLTSYKNEQTTNDQEHSTTQEPVVPIMSKLNEKAQSFEEKYSTEKYLTTNDHISKNESTELQTDGNQYCVEKSNCKTGEPLSDDILVINEDCEDHNMAYNPVEEIKQNINYNAIPNEQPYIMGMNPFYYQPYLMGMNPCYYQPYLMGMNPCYYQPYPMGMNPSYYQQFSGNSQIQRDSTENMLISNMKMYRCDPCVRIGVISESMKWCLECEECLCAFCCRYHQQMKELLTHTLIPITKIKKRRYHLNKMCTSHKEQFKYYCKNHSALLCSKCLLHDHRNCTLVYTIDELCSADLLHSLNDNGKALQRLSDDLSLIENQRVQNTCSDRIKEEFTALENESTNTYEKLMRFKNEFENEMVALEREIKTMSQNITERYDQILIMEEFKTYSLMIFLVESSKKFLSHSDKEVHELRKRLSTFRYFANSK